VRRDHRTLVGGEVQHGVRGALMPAFENSTSRRPWRSTAAATAAATAAPSVTSAPGDQGHLVLEPRHPRDATSYRSGARVAWYTGGASVSMRQFALAGSDVSSLQPSTS
jgi:hypothetical protein